MGNLKKLLQSIGFIICATVLGACGSGGGGGAASVGPAFETVTRDIIYYAGCESPACNFNTLWIYDPTLQTSFAVDVTMEVDNIDDAKVIDNKLYFSGDDGTSGHEIWVYDMLAPVSPGINPVLTHDLKPGNDGSEPDEIFAVGSKLYFSADTTATGNELFVLDTEAPFGASNPSLVADIYPGTDDSNIFSVTFVGDKITFVAGSTDGEELAIFDPNQPISASNPEIIDIYAGANSSSPEYFLVEGDKMYFVAAQAATAYELWVYDSTLPTSGTNPQLVADVYSGAFTGTRELIGFIDNKLYFQGENAATGRELFVYDPSVAVGVGNPQVAVDMSTGGSSTNFDDYIIHNGKLYFGATVAPDGEELWIYDPSQAVSGSNPLMVDIRPGGNSSSPSYFTLINNDLYFTASEDTNGNELWKLDTSTAITATNPALLYDLEPGTGNSWIDEINAVGKVLYFAGQNSTEGREFWKLDSELAVGASNPTVVNGFDGSSDQMSPYDIRVHSYTVEVEVE